MSPLAGGPVDRARRVGHAPHDAVATSAHLIVASAGDSATGRRLAGGLRRRRLRLRAPFVGSAGDLPLVRPVVGMTPTADDQGYWLVASDGGIFAFGDAAFYGSWAARRSTGPSWAWPPPPTAAGYWLVASDGGVFAFGDAAFFGSMGGAPLNRPIVGMAATPDGGGYWLVASDGGIFAFGDAAFDGSTGGIALEPPVVGMQPDARRGGYRLVAADGGLFSFGTPFAGSAVGAPARAVVSLDSPAAGYRIVSADGGSTPSAGPPFLGSVASPRWPARWSPSTPVTTAGNGGDPAFIDRPIDGGGFTEPCDTAGTTDRAGYPEHAFNFDVATRLAGLLTAGGATVVLTRPTDTGVGPCVDVRAAIGNAAGLGRRHLDPRRRRARCRAGDSPSTCPCRW